MCTSSDIPTHQEQDTNPSTLIVSNVKEEPTHKHVRIEIFPAVTGCSAIQSKVGGMREKAAAKSARQKPMMNRLSAILDLRKMYRMH